MSKKKILVTGANGYIGRFVVKNLLDLGFNVIASDFTYDKVDDRAEKSNTAIFNGDSDIYELIGKPDILIHLAWRNGFSHDNESHIADLSNHFTFINNMIKGGLKHLSIMGTMHETGYWEGKIDENTPSNPLSLYGISKDALRRSLKNITHNNKDIIFQWLRAYYIFGDDLNNNSIFTKIIKAEEAGEEYFPFNSGKNKYDFITVTKLAEQIAAASSQTEITGEINCCSGNPISLADKVEAFIKENNMRIKLKYGVFPDRPYDSPIIYGDNNKIRKIMDNLKNREKN